MGPFCRKKTFFAVNFFPSLFSLVSLVPWGNCLFCSTVTHHWLLAEVKKKIANFSKITNIWEMNIEMPQNSPKTIWWWFYWFLKNLRHLKMSSRSVGETASTNVCFPHLERLRFHISNDLFKFCIEDAANLLLANPQLASNCHWVSYWIAISINSLMAKLEVCVLFRHWLSIVNTVEPDLMCFWQLSRLQCYWRNCNGNLHLSNEWWHKIWRTKISNENFIRLKFLSNSEARDICTIITLLVW